MSHIYKDILTGMVFFTGLLGFTFGEFIISAVLFAIAATASNVNLPRKRVKTRQLSW